jgi:hypothetical protein
MNDFLAGSTSH